VALEIVNACQHGNGTALFTRSGPAARKFQDEVQVRGVWAYRLSHAAVLSTARTASCSEDHITLHNRAAGLVAVHAVASASCPVGSPKRCRGAGAGGEPARAHAAGARGWLGPTSA